METYPMQQEQSNKQELLSYPQPPYVPATQTTIGSFPHIKSSILIASQREPNRICGYAKRVGSIEKSGREQTLYRLKFRRSLTKQRTTTLPNLFILENGVFVEYEQSRHMEHVL